MVRILVYPANPDGRDRCAARLVWPAEVLATQGADIGIVRGREDPVWEGGCDVVVMQRPMLRRYVEGISPFETVGAIQRLQADGIKVVVDVDDDFKHLHEKNAVWHNVHPTQSPDCNWQHLSTACRLADLVTVTTPALAAIYGGHGRVAIIPNHIPESYLAIERPNNDVPVVGWAGAVKVHPNDLQETGGGVASAVRSTGAEFGLVGPPDHVQEHLWLKEPPVLIQERLGLPVQTQFVGIDDDDNEVLEPRPGWVDLDDYGIAAAQLDVGIVPLEMTAFNQAKSCLKMTEFSALGVPCIGSPTEPNLWFAKRFGGVIAKRPRDWEREIKRLVNNPEQRANTGGLVREAMTDWTIEKRCEEWFDAWTMPIRRRRAG